MASLLGNVKALEKKWLQKFNFHMYDNISKMDIVRKIGPKHSFLPKIEELKHIATYNK